jgi:hypothetical protein
LRAHFRGNVIAVKVADMNVVNITTMNADISGAAEAGKRRAIMNGRTKS